MSDHVERLLAECGECDFGREIRARVVTLLEIDRALKWRVSELVALVRERSDDFDADHMRYFLREFASGRRVGPAVLRVTGPGVVVFMDGAHRTAAALLARRQTVRLVVLGYDGDEDAFENIVGKLAA